MYTPTHNKVDNLDWIKLVIEDAPFATFITDSGISHLPILLQDIDGHLTLVSHMARMNSQKLKNGDSARILFNGPHAYVSPVHYTDDPSNVPTWNYVAVHVTGTVEIIEDRARVELAMKDLIEHFENRYQTGWTYDARPEQTVMYSSIVVFKIHDLKFQAKFKLHQNQSMTNRLGVITGLSSRGKPQKDAQAIAEWMKKTLL